MSPDITLKEKKEFLAWFLDHYQLKRRESMWILNYLLNHEVVLNKVRFVEDAEKTPRGILMSTIGNDQPAFQFYKEGQLFDNPEQAFHEVRLNWNNDLYLELFFENSLLSEEYILVLEDNPYYKWNDTIPEETLKEAEEGLNAFLLNQKKANLLIQIDQSLEKDNRASFILLSKELKQLELESQKNYKYKEV